MTKTVNLNQISTEILIKLAKSGDEIVLEENGKPIAKITPILEVEETNSNQQTNDLSKE